jgi:cell division protein FtsA
MAQTQKEEIIAGLDLGTTKACVIVGLKSAPTTTEPTKTREIEVLGIGHLPSQGIKKGAVVDIECATDCLVAAVEAAEEMADVEIGSLYVSMTGSHVRSFNSFGSTPITREHYEITDEDIEKTITAAKAVSIPMERMVLHVLPHEYIVDGQSGIRQPRGMSGVKLEVGVHIVTGAITAAQNVVKCLNRAEIECEELILSSIASAASTLSDEEKEMGVVLIDMGGGTADTAVYVDNALKLTDVLGCGGYQITNDIAHALRLPLNRAEDIKKNHGSALRSNISGTEEFSVPGVLDRPTRTMPVRELVSIIEPRVEEIFLRIKSRIQAAGLNQKIGSGIVLTGGGALLKDIDKLASRVFNVPVRIGKVCGVKGIDHILESPTFATTVGLLKMANASHKHKKNKTPSSQHRLLHVVRGWMKKMMQR